ncbi:unnamed protein product [marine sediment metagenome]|uniref:RNA polymerase sigma-70 region 4 domain-containing protein n=1 Tax=marine sediment metagenome TaxID=412755 RepID=X1J146_9ZZZZ
MPNPGEKILTDLYYVKDGSLQKIADIYGVSRERARQWMEKWGLPRNRSGGKNLLDESNPNICDEYIKGEPVVKLAKKYKVCKTTIYKFLLECNPSIRLEKKRFREKERSTNERLSGC